MLGGTREPAIRRVQPQELLDRIGQQGRIFPQLLLELRIARQVHGDASEKYRRCHESDHEHLAHTPGEQRLREWLPLRVARRQQRTGRVDVGVTRLALAFCDYFSRHLGELCGGGGNAALVEGFPGFHIGLGRSPQNRRLLFGETQPLTEHGRGQRTRESAR